MIVSSSSIVESISSFSFDFSSEERISKFELLALLNLYNIKSISLSVISFFRFSLIASSFLYFDIRIENLLSNSIIFLFKQLTILIPFFIMGAAIIKKYKCKINIKDKKTLFLISINLIPLILMLITSILTGAKIRTMWMTPFYLFLGTLFIFIFKQYIETKKIKRFYYIFLTFFIFSPTAYLAISLLDETKRTDYPGKEIARLVQNKWNDNFMNEIKIVIGDEWSAGNLSYHLNSRPIWINELKNNTSNITDEQGVIYTGNPKILKKICPGVFGTIKPYGYCMIGKR